LTVRHLAPERDADDRRRSRLRDVVNAEQLAQLDFSADLLTALAHRGVSRTLVVIDEAAGQAPLAVRGVDGPASQDYAGRRFDDDGRRHLRVAPQDEIVVRADLDRASFDRARDQGRSAVDAKVAHPGRA
jgi:hypothetical protein